MTTTSASPARTSHSTVIYAIALTATLIAAIACVATLEPLGFFSALAGAAYSLDGLTRG